MELQQVLHPQGLEQEHYIGKVGPLDLRHGGGQELVLVSTLCVESAREKPMTGLYLPQAGLPASPMTGYTQEPHSRTPNILFKSLILTANKSYKQGPAPPTSICSTRLLTLALPLEPPIRLGEPKCLSLELQQGLLS